MNILLPLERFMSKVEKTNGHWIWTDTPNSGGYGSFRDPVTKRKLGAHVHSYIMFKGERVPGLDICHTCDIRLCVNPDHLWQGTRGQNIQDMLDKGKGNTRKLSISDINEIRTLRASGTPAVDLANRFGVTKYYIYRVAKKETWKWHEH